MKNLPGRVSQEGRPGNGLPPSLAPRRPLGPARVDGPGGQRGRGWFLHPETPRPLPVRAAGGAMRVLVVDDAPDVAATFSVLLKMWGHEVRVAADGASALALAAEY